MTFFLRLFDPEDEGAMILQDIGKDLPIDTVSHPRRLKYSAATL
jgi:hypothetical protein